MVLLLDGDLKFAGNILQHDEGHIFAVAQVLDKALHLDRAANFLLYLIDIGAFHGNRQHGQGAGLYREPAQQDVYKRQATTNQSGFLRCEATRVGEDTTLAQIIKMVSDAAATKAPIAKIADTVSGFFVPAVISIAVVTTIVWLLLGHELGYALARGISVLVISCPCALGLATPVAIMVGNGLGAKNGILFKTAASLEAAGRTQIVALDKTGTITEGAPRVTDLLPAEGVTETELLTLAAALEGRSEHPLAKAVLADAEAKAITPPEVTDFAALPGNGLAAKLDGMDIYAGNAAFIQTKLTLPAALAQQAEKLASEGKTPLFFGGAGRLLGVIAEKLVSVGPEHPEGFEDFHQGIEQAAPFVRPQQVNTNDDISLMYFTSGTTGEPKMVAHDFTYPLGHIVTGSFWHNLHPNSLHLTIADTGWGKAVWGKLYGQMIAGANIFVYDHEKFTPADILQKIHDYHITSLCAPPTIYRFLIREDLTKYDLSSLEYCTTAGEALNYSVYETFKRITGIRLMEGFGQTETTLTLATFPWMEPKPGSMGVPNPQYDIDLLTPDGRSAEDGEQGQIVIHTDKGKPLGLFKEYYRAPELTREAWHDGIYYTGDVAWRDEDGYYWFVGRADDVIKSSGYRIGPFEVESALMTHPAVVECAITGVPDEIRGQVVKATIVLAKDYRAKAGPELIKELQDHVKRVTAPYKYPRVIEFVDELPKTISGKIRRVEIRQKDRG